MLPASSPTPHSTGAPAISTEPRDRVRQFLQSRLDPADVRLNGDRPWDVQVSDPRFYGRVVRQGSLGLGLSYMDGWWECDQLEEFFYRVLRARVDEAARTGFPAMVARFAAGLTNRQRKSRAFEIGERHYDLGNDLFERMLDARMIYSCGYWAGASTLDEAQEAKLDLICHKLGLRAGMRILDIGCGWGGLVRYAAEHFGVTCVGITVSREQAEYARESVRELPIEIRLQDYRDVDEPFDAVVSVGMFEHVGHRNHRAFMEVAYRCLPDEGLLLLHTIGSNVSRTATDPWIDRFIFPGGVIPSVRQIAEAAEGLFVLEDWHSFGPHYHRTLLAWHENFMRRWHEIAHVYGERFYRMWRYYLQSTAGGFRARRNQLWQIVLSKGGVEGGYVSVR